MAKKLKKNKKNTFNVLIFILILTSLYSNLYAETYISGNIYTNTTWTESGSPYIITSNVVIGRETFTDLNGNDLWDSSPEPYEDKNNNGRYDQSEPFVDIYPNGRWDPHEPFNDLNGNGIWDQPFVLNISPGVEVQTSTGDNRLKINGRIDATGVIFSGS